jgi:membrane associated rhomboid family serine protease
MFPIRDSVPTRHFPFVNYFLIAVNLVVFFFELMLSSSGTLDAFFQSYALIPEHFFKDPMSQMFTVFTAMFLHGGWAHVIGNMWFLHVFGDNVEDNLGPVRYFFFYLLVGAGAAAAQLAANPNSALPMVGASGAIAGILGAYFILHPGARVLTFFIFFFIVRFVEIPAFFFLGLWFVIQAVNGIGSISDLATRADTGGVAWWAHAGGFAAGFALIPFFKRRGARYSR